MKSMAERIQEACEQFEAQFKYTKPQSSDVLSQEADPIQEEWAKLLNVEVPAKPKLTRVNIPLYKSIVYDNGGGEWSVKVKDTTTGVEETWKAVGDFMQSQPLNYTIFYDF